MSRRNIARYWVLSQNILARPGQRAVAFGLKWPKIGSLSSPADPRLRACRPIPCPIHLSTVHCPFSSDRNPPDNPCEHRRNHGPTIETPNHRDKSLWRVPLKQWARLNILPIPALCINWRYLVEICNGSEEKRFVANKKLSSFLPNPTDPDAELTLSQVFPPR